MTNKPMLSVERELLKKWHRDLDACQRVIWLAGGFDPAYCKDAQDCLKEMDEALANASPPHQGESAAYVQFLADVMTAAGLVAHGKQDKKFAERLADECARLQVEHFALPVAAANSIPAYEAPETGEKWSLTGDNGSWDYDSLDELLKDNYGHDSDGDGHPASYRAGLYEGGTVYRGTECKDDPATFLPDQDDLLEHMSERAYDSDAGEWADNYPALDSDAKLELERAMQPLKAWARKHCQPEFFTIKDITPHIVTVEDVSRSRKS